MIKPRSKPEHGLKRPKNAIVPTVPPVFTELEQRGLVVPVSLGRGRRRAPSGKRAGR